MGEIRDQRLPCGHHAVPNSWLRGYESFGSITLDEIIQQGTRYLQEKLAALVTTFCKARGG